MTEALRNRHATRSLRAVVILVSLLAEAAFADRARADRFDREDVDATSASIELPPPPRERPTLRAVEVNVGLAAPFANGSLCPNGSECVLGTGGLIGFTYEWWRRSGLGLGIGYDLAILDGGTIWEATTMHDLRLNGRYLFLPERAIHPFLGFGGGVVLLGNLFHASTVGGAVDARIGAEFEVTDSLSFTISMSVRAFSVAPFTTSEDDVQRSRHGVPNVLGLFQVGVVLVPSVLH